MYEDNGKCWILLLNVLNYCTRQIVGPIKSWIPLQKTNYDTYFWANKILPYMWGPTLKLEEGLKTFTHRLTRRWAKKYWGLLFTIRVKLIKLTRSVFTTVFWHVANSLDLQRGRGRVRGALHVQCVGPVTELGVAFNCLPSTGRKSADAATSRESKCRRTSQRHSLCSLVQLSIYLF